MYFVYVLKGCRNNFYKGLTNNIERRLNEHLNGENQTTHNMAPLKLVHVEVCLTRSKARRLEKYLKSGYGREIIKEIDSELR